MPRITKQKGKILIVEDESVLSELFADKFASEGFEALQAPSAEEGLELALKKKPDFILLDIMLPKMDGISMLRILRENSWGKNVPVIILSNVADQQKVSEAMKLGVYDYIVKTNLILNELVKQVKEVISH